MTEERLQTIRQRANQSHVRSGTPEPEDWYEAEEDRDSLLTHIDALQERIAELEAVYNTTFDPVPIEERARAETATAILREIGNCNCANCERMRDICRAQGAKEA